MAITVICLIVSLIIFILSDCSSKQFQFVEEQFEINYFGLYFGIDGLSNYFVLLTAIIMPIAIISNWKSIKQDLVLFLIIILLLDTSLLLVFLILDNLLFYIFFESNLAPLFILIGFFGSNEKIRASFYLFLYTLFEAIKDLFFRCKRAKLRVSPKALVTKVIEETLLLAWLMTQGMVTSLVFATVSWKSTHNGRWLKLKWDIADLNQVNPVKEQRVDGSSDSLNLYPVRCTLAAGKPVFGRKFYFHQDNHRVVMELRQRAFIHSTRPTQKSHISSEQINNISTLVKPTTLTIKKLNPWFITGFIDAMGCFMIQCSPSIKKNVGYQVDIMFKLSLHKKDYDLLYQIKDYFGTGTITKHGTTTIQYKVTNLSNSSIISHLDKYPLSSEKWAEFELFKHALKLVMYDSDLSEEGFRKINNIKTYINSGFCDRLKLGFLGINSVSRPSLFDTGVKDPNWLAGFTSGVGSFSISILKSSTCKKDRTVIKFQIAQHSRDTKLMKILIPTLGCGKIKQNYIKSAVDFWVTSYRDIADNIIPFFDLYPIKGVKASDFSDFRKVAILMSKKAHLTEKGLSEIKSIKSNMDLRSSV